MLTAATLLQLFHLSLEAQVAGITCPSNRTVPTDPGKCSAVVNNIDPVVSPVGAAITYRIENGAIVTTGFGSASGVSFLKGLNTIKYSLQDDAGVFCTFTIISPR